MRPKIKITILLLTLGVLFVSSAVININFSGNLISIDDTIEVDDENIGVDEDNSEVNDNLNLKSPRKSGYWGPSEVSFIHINNNWTLARDNLPWVQGGDGSWGNPFFIENVTIDASGSSTGCGILIENSDVYFRIENCTVYNSIYREDCAGIQLRNTDNGNLINNKANNNNNVGMRLRDSNNNTILGNDANNNNGNGIGLFDSEDNIVSGNDANNNNGHSGIFLCGCYNNTVSGNTVNNNNPDGIFLHWSHYNTISGNIANDNEHAGIVLKSSNYNTITGNTLIDNNIGIDEDDSCVGNIFENNQIEDYDDDDDDDDVDYSLSLSEIIMITYAIIIFIIIMIILFSLLSYATKSKPKKDIKNRLRMVTNLIQKEQFLQAINELNNIIEEAKLKNFDGIVKQANDKLRICHELKEIKTELENRFPEIENLIQTKDFSKATNELETVISIAKQRNFVEIISWGENNLDLCANLKKITKKDIQNRLRMVKDLIREEQFSVAIKELNNIVEEAKFQNFDGIVKRADKKLRMCQELEKIKADLEKRFPTIENLIQTKDFSKAINELKNVRITAKQHKFVEIVSWTEKNLGLCNNLIIKKIKAELEKRFPEIENLIQTEDFSKAINELENVRITAKQHKFVEIVSWTEKNLGLCNNLIIKKTVLELGSKFGRIQTIEISEKTGIKDKKLIINLIQEMIENKEIYAEYFSSSKSILFNQQINSDEIDKLMEAFKEWEEKKEGKKI